MGFFKKKKNRDAHNKGQSVQTSSQGTATVLCQEYTSRLKKSPLI